MWKVTFDHSPHHICNFNSQFCCEVCGLEDTESHIACTDCNSHYHQECFVTYLRIISGNPKIKKIIPKELYPITDKVKSDWTLLGHEESTVKIERTKLHTPATATFIKVALKFEGYEEYTLDAYVDTGAGMCLAKKTVIPMELWTSSAKPRVASIADKSRIYLVNYADITIKIGGYPFKMKVWEADCGVDLLIGNQFNLEYQPFIQYDKIVEWGHPHSNCQVIAARLPEVQVIKDDLFLNNLRKPTNNTCEVSELLIFTSQKLNEKIRTCEKISKKINEDLDEIELKKIDTPPSEEITVDQRPKQDGIKTAHPDFSFRPQTGVKITERNIYLDNPCIGATKFDNERII